MNTSQMDEVTSEDELAEIIGAPLQRVIDKVRPVLDDLHADWLSHSPFCLVATALINN